MNYQQQQTFFRKYSVASLVCTLLLLVVEAIQYRYGEYIFTTWQIITNSLFTLALLYSLIYLPKYLHITVELEKRCYWSVRIRWILAALLLLFGALAVEKTNWYIQYQALLIGIALLLGTNLTIRYLLKRQGWGRQYRWLGLCYLLADAVMLYIVFQAFLPNPILAALLTALAAHLAIQLEVKLPALLLLLLLNWNALPAMILFLICYGVSYSLTIAGAQHNKQNHKQAVVALMGFTGESQEKIAELLLTSTGKLAADWQRKQPQTREAVEAWYRDNAQYYIYDLAQYHLAYKHIIFTLDVLSLARGRVLDYGAGIGDLALALAIQGCQVTYFDVEGESKRYAQWQTQQHNLTVTFASEHREIAAESFDTIIILDVLEHLYEPAEVLEFLLARLADGGTLIASAYFGATKAHPMHLDHKLDIADFLRTRGLCDAKGVYLRFFGSQAMRRRPMFVYRKPRQLTNITSRVAEQTA
ncbi:MAG: methyltransferase domain-containing protein [Acidobacteriota bacterium]